MSDMDEQDLKRTQESLEWWQMRLPPGWEVSGWTFRRFAQVLSPKGRVVHMDGELMEALSTPGVLLQSRYASGLTARGWSQQPQTSGRYLVFTKDSARGSKYFLGNKGSLRVGPSYRESRPALSTTKNILLAGPP